MADPLTFPGVDLAAIRDRLGELEFFHGVTDIQSAAQIIEGDISFVPPWAFVMVESESFAPNRYAAGGHGQLATSIISVLFALPSQRAADDLSDEFEQARRAVRDCLKGWTPPGAMVALDARRFQVRLIADGIIWGEWLFGTRYDLV